MCFSAEADFVAGVAIAAIGVQTLRSTHERRELPLAALPLILGVHQFVEGFVWLGLEGVVASSTGRAAMWVYVLIAFVLLPVYVPGSVLVIDSSPRRRRLLAGFVVLGAVIATVLLATSLTGDAVGATIERHHIDYSIGLAGPVLVIGLYLVATCGSAMASSDRRLRAFGAVNLVGAVLIAWIDATAFISLWCLWAALISRRGRPSPPAPPAARGDRAPRASC